MSSAWKNFMHINCIKCNDHTTNHFTPCSVCIQGNVWFIVTVVESVPKIWSSTAFKKYILHYITLHWIYITLLLHYLLLTTSDFVFCSIRNELFHFCSRTRLSWGCIDISYWMTFSIGQLFENLLCIQKLEFSLVCSETHCVV